DVRADELDALVMPGGFGAAKNLSDFALKGPEATVHQDLARLLRDVHAQRKPIGAICIAPAVVACALGGSAKPRLTIGDDRATAAALTAMGAEHEDSPVDRPVVDERNRIVSVAAFMYEARLKDIAAGIDALVAAIAAMVAEGGR
ncbi:MAG TPA: isoprenoid biosynthesis protein ElbB, partial [bacterium]|nr:isoprenoid biosynthesis protein ElbB [bacterium]